MFYVYILRSIKFPTEIYIGFTGDLKQRLKDHNSGHSSHTAKFLPWRIAHASVFVDEDKAHDFEKYLKSSSGRAFLKKRLV